MDADPMMQQTSHPPGMLPAQSASHDQWGNSAQQPPPPGYGNVPMQARGQPHMHSELVFILLLAFSPLPSHLYLLTSTFSPLPSHLSTFSTLPSHLYLLSSTFSPLPSHLYHLAMS